MKLVVLAAVGFLNFSASAEYLLQKQQLKGLWKLNRIVGFRDPKPLWQRCSNYNYGDLVLISDEFKFHLCQKDRLGKVAICGRPRDLFYKPSVKTSGSSFNNTRVDAVAVGDEKGTNYLRVETENKDVLNWTYRAQPFTTGTRVDESESSVIFSY